MKLFKFLFSGLFMTILLLIFAISMGYATFVENDFDAITAKALIFHSWWFKTLMYLMVINFSGMIFTKRLYKKSKWNILIIHVALIIVIIGAGITHYLGYEGMMHIREGQTTNKFISADPYFYATVSKGDEQEVIYKKVWLTGFKKDVLEEELTVQNQKIKFKLKEYLPNTVREVVHDESGKAIVTIIAATSSGRKVYFLEENNTIIINGLPFALNADLANEAVHIQVNDDSLQLNSPLPLLHNNKHGSGVDTLNTNEWYPIDVMDLYQAGEVIFVIREFEQKAKMDFVVADEETSSGQGISIVEVAVNDQQETLNLIGGQGIVGKQEDIDIDGVHISVSVGASIWQLPFYLRLNKFILDRYPGSMSPSSFASEITLIDEKKGVEEPYKVFMNNILSYKGFRFYQSSYDTDEKGTILSVNHDQLGTTVTYVGYFLLFVSLLVSLFTRKTRFAKLSQLINEVHEERKKLINIGVVAILSLASMGSAYAQDKSEEVIAINHQHANAFGELLMQTKGGRIVPVNTMNSQLLRKIYKKNSYQGLSADQVVLSMMLQPSLWRELPIIKVYDEHVQEMLGISGEYAAWEDFFNEESQYILRDRISAAYEKSPAFRSKLEKELISVDERLNVCTMALGGSFLSIFPLPNDPDHRWVSQYEFQQFVHQQGLKTNQVFLTEYVKQLNIAAETNDYAKADEVLQALKQQQKELGEAIIPSNAKISLEIFYNKANIFYRMFPIFLTFGMVLLALFLLQLFWPSLDFPKTEKVFLILLWILFAIQTIGLAIRWYISGHAPWSNGYESMIYIAWAIMLAGLALRHKSTITLALTAILAGITLLTAHMSWLNPEITNLVPVLKSYWLTFHVATITASYGFFALASLMGFLNLSLMIFRNTNNKLRINLTIKELTLIIEMSMFIGLILLTIGNFLGGIWANESWGRYWGWDPKETWSLITIIVYTFILHLRLIPSLKSLFSTNFGALIGFGSVLMTYFGVNYYLSGLHSYAQGDPVPVPDFVYYALVIIFIVSVLAGFNTIKHMKGSNENIQSNEE